MTTVGFPVSTVLYVATTSTNPYVYCKVDGSVGDGGDSVFNPVVKIVVEQAKVDSKYVHLRFSYNNKYWQKSADDNTIVAVSNKPVEDTADPSCTLFEPMVDGGELYLAHVPTDGHVIINNSTNTLYVDGNITDFTLLGFVNADTLVQLPTHIALKGDNGKYLRAYDTNGWRLQFGSDEATDELAGHTVTLMPNGQVRILSDHFNLFWWTDFDSQWVYADWNESKGSETTSFFWPVKINENTIALRNADNNQFCIRSGDDCLAASEGAITTKGRIQVEELVMKRKFYNVGYRMEDARIYGETPFLAGTTTLTNTTEEEDSMAVEITYQDEKSYTFSRGVSLTAGVSVTVEAGVPFVAEGQIQISFEINESFEWDTTKTTTTSVKASGTIPVPAKSSVKVDYVGTRGTCNVPYAGVWCPLHSGSHA